MLSDKVINWKIVKDITRNEHRIIIFEVKHSKSSNNITERINMDKVDDWIAL